MSRLLDISEQIAREAHAGQFYNDGEGDYVELHIIPVVNVIIRMGYGEKHQAVGWVHDTGEDGGVTATDMLEHGLPLDVVEAADLLRKKGDPDEVYLREISRNGLAVVGKVADASVNLASTVLRAPEIDRQTFDRWFHRYTGYLNFLMPFLPPSESE